VNLPYLVAHLRQVHTNFTRSSLSKSITSGRGEWLCNKTQRRRVIPSVTLFCLGAFSLDTLKGRFVVFGTALVLVVEER